MRKAKVVQSPATERRTRPATDPDARENQLVSLAYDLVEKRLREGTATSQETTHFLKIGSRRERLEREILEKQRDLVGAKTKHIEAQERNEEMYTKALEAMRRYSGNANNGDEDDQDIF